MAPHSLWRGYLKLSLVTCAVAMTPATSESEKIRFHTLNRATGNRVDARYVDAETGKPVAEDDQAKGYQRGADDYVLLDDDELESAALASTRTLDIDMFVPRKSVDWIWYDTPHYLAPDDAVGAEAFSVIREAMAVTGTVGIARLVLYRRERAVMLEPLARGIVLWTLRYGDEVRNPNDYFASIEAEKLDPPMMSLVSKVIDRRTAPWEPKMLGDPVEDNFVDLIAGKRKGKRPNRAKPRAEARPNVVNIMDVLRKSLAAGGN